MRRKNKLVLFAMGWYEARVHLGALDYAREHNWRLLGDEHRTDMPSNISPDGIILSACQSQPLLDWAQSFAVPMVLVSENGFGLDLPCVMPDYARIGRMAADFFAGRGFKHFASVYPHPMRPSPWHLERLEGFKAGVAAAGGTLHCLLRPEARGKRGGRHEDLAKIRWMTRELERLPLPLAVFITDDSDARLFEQACVQTGLCIPEQVAVLGVNNDPMECPYAAVPLSSIDPDWHAVGWKAAELLDRCLAGETVAAPQPLLVPPKGVVERQSTSIIAVEDRRVADAVFHIRENYAADPTVDEVCDAVGVPRRTLEHLFQQHLSRGIKEEIVRNRIRRIQALLKETNLSGTAIAGELGFKTVHYMYRLFKEHTGMTTRQFRETGTR